MKKRDKGSPSDGVQPSKIFVRSKNARRSPVILEQNIPSFASRIKVCMLYFIKLRDGDGETCQTHRIGCERSDRLLAKL